jgi:hypothetical protein
MIKLWHLLLVILTVLIGIALGQDIGPLSGTGDWLSGSPYYMSGPYYYGSPYSSDVPMSFAVPYYTSPTASSNFGYSPYYGDQLFPDYTPPAGYSPSGSPFYPGTYPYYYGTYPYQPYYQPNWTATINYAQTQSSFRVYQNGAWVTA